LSTHACAEQTPLSQRLLQQSVFAPQPVPEAPHATLMGWQVLPAAVLHAP
jgi:hypothetical protein